MSRRSAYSALNAPLVVGRVAAFPIDVAIDLYSDPDPLAATRAFFAGNEHARLALEIASPSLFAAVASWIDGSAPEEKVKLRALSYALRMSTRCTPFGLFSGVAGVAFGGETAVTFDPSLSLTSTRPDMSLIGDLVEAAEAEARDGIGYITNDCAFVRGDRLHVIDVQLASAGQNDNVEQRDVSLRHTRAVSFLRAFCATVQSFGEIVRALAAEFGATEDEARKLAERLIGAGVLLSELRPPATNEPASYIEERFHSSKIACAPDLSDAIARTKAFDAAPDSRVDSYHAMLDAFRALSPQSKHAVQIDLHAGLRGELSQEVAHDVAALADLLARSGRVFRMNAFRERFIERYEGLDRLVPLLELVDGNVGLGLPEGGQLESTESPERDEALMRIFGEAIRNGCEEIDLGGSNLELFAPAHGKGRAMTGFEIGFALAGSRLIMTLLCDRVGKTAARFANMLGTEFCSRLRESVAASFNPEDVVAEFSFAPIASRAYNVVVRPLVHDYEVRAGIGAPPTGTAISPSDIYVGIGEDDAFYLWSQNLQRRILVSETHAVGTAKSAPNLCRFLAQIQLDGVRVPELDLGIVEKLAYLPRLVLGNIVITPRRWLLGRSDFETSDRIHAVRETWNMPRYLYLTEGDHRLLLDLDAPISKQLALVHSTSKQLVFEEALPAPDDAWVRSSRGYHAAEFVAAVTSVVQAPKRTGGPAPVVVKQRARYGAGSRWVYAKYYLGARSIDDLLRKMAPALMAFDEGADVDRWFFVRYADPRTHLRVRLYCSSREAAVRVRETIAAQAQRLLDDSAIDRFVFDTYDPEYERYGGEEQLEAAERYFHADSCHVLAWITEGHNATDARVEAAAASFDPWLRGSDRASSNFVRDFAKAAAGKLRPFDRDALVRLRKVESPPQVGLDSERLGAYLHMHCNRFGLDPDGERRVVQLCRALALSRDHVGAISVV
jgi:hypothetical protein